MLLTRKSALPPFKTHTLELPITEEELKRWEGGEYVQKVWPHLSPDQREFIISGITPEEWAAAFPPEKEDL